MIVVAKYLLPPDASLPAARLILFLSDLHFGRADAATERQNERAAIACIEAHADRLTHLYLVGDVYEAWIEYRHLVPRPRVRFLSTLLRLVDAGVRVTYLAGNHDPWHGDFFQEELGVHVVMDEVTATHFGRRLHIAHGDGLLPRGLYRRLKPILRHRLPVWIYKNLLPGDFGMRLALRTSEGSRRPGYEQVQVEALRAYAHDHLRGGADAVVMGHSHFAEHVVWRAGDYVNLGAWYETCTFGRLDDDGLHLLQWTEGGAERLTMKLMREEA